MIGHRVIPAVAPPAQTRFQMMRMAETSPRIAAKLRALIAVNQDMPGLATPHGHEERVQHEFLGHRGLCCPANNSA